jgi:xylan 1,4-beta-xylosidase
LRSVFLLAAMLIAAPASAAEPVVFDWFEYQGKDPTYDLRLKAGEFRNPILPGYFPDPSIERVGDRYWLVNSTFAHYPGIPIHESRDLVHWRLVGHALSDPNKLKFDGRDISRGVFAPSIHHHDGTFYVINTLVDAGGNFFVTARDPKGPWSDPVWLPEVEGIDPSFFFDDDGKAYILNNGGPEGKPLYDGHRAIWMQQFDLTTQKVTGARRVLVNGGADFAKQPIWIEGPHLYRIDGWYYLMCAEGGTGPGHSEVIFRSRDVWGPYEPNPRNPILTQRDLPANRANPVSNAGHADLVQAPDKSWWAVFLASRPYQGDRYNTGRETWLLPVRWQDGWPVILEKGKPIPYVAKGPATLPRGKRAPTHDPQAGNFTLRDEFDDPTLAPHWLQIYAPAQAWYDTTSNPGALTIRPLAVPLDAKRNASFLARRQQHLNFEASVALTPPKTPGVAAGLAAFQNANHWYFAGARRTEAGVQVFLERRDGEKLQVTTGSATADVSTVRLRIRASGAKYSFFYSLGAGAWQTLQLDDDGSILSTEVAGGFVGTVLGPYARQESP